MLHCLLVYRNIPAKSKVTLDLKVTNCSGVNFLEHVQVSPAKLNWMVPIISFFFLLHSSREPLIRTADNSNVAAVAIASW